jgi:hypothetical protein
MKSNIVAVSFIGGENRSTQKKKPTDLPQATDKLYHIMLYRSTPPRHEQSSNSQLLW